MHYVTDKFIFMNVDLEYLRECLRQPLLDSIQSEMSTMIRSVHIMDAIFKQYKGIGNEKNRPKRYANTVRHAEQIF